MGALPTYCPDVEVTPDQQKAMPLSAFECIPGCPGPDILPVRRPGYADMPLAFIRKCHLLGTEVEVNITS